ncbi:zinc transporter ZIP1-like isoform X5 [Eleginops maclovinus]|uniref:zinc transporter ZIP1-like isoform X5 n=1 Tax=Eleginops maclovinus TaxID=56733 RepID=UPI003080E4DC
MWWGGFPPRSSGLLGGFPAWKSNRELWFSCSPSRCCSDSARCASLGEGAAAGTHVLYSRRINEETTSAFSVSPVLFCIGFRHRLLSLISCFAGGVFLATCLLEQLPVYLQSITEAFSSAGVTLQFPLPEFIMAMGFFLVLVLEQIILAFKDQPQMEESCALWLPNSGINSHRHGVSEQSGGSHFHVDLSSQSALRSFVLVFSLSLHSVLEGLAVGLQETCVARQVLTLGLMVHKSIISFSLACTLTRGRLRRPLVACCLLLFAAMSPLGIGLGSALWEKKAPRQHRLARCTLQGLAAGSFLYITFMEILPHELGSGGNRIPKVAALLAGFAVVTAVLFIKL